jgi:cytochrome c oxidase subunit 3
LSSATLNANSAKNFEGKKLASSIAMTMVLVSFSMLFATMLLGYVVYRSQSTTWPPMGMSEVPLLLPTVSTIIIILGSIFFSLSRDKVSFLYLSIISGVAFLISQIKLWALMKSMGLTVSAGIFTSLIYGFTWTHTAHILLALSLLLWLLSIHREGFPYEKAELRFINVGKFWHFLTIIWIVIYFALFIV